MTQVVLRPSARNDLSSSKEWYEAQRPGLGSEFLGCVDAAFAALARDPSLATKLADGVYRVLIRRFPFGIYFLSEPDRVVVLAILHQRRNPSIWRQRR